MKIIRMPLLIPAALVLALSACAAPPAAVETAPVSDPPAAVETAPAGPDIPLNEESLSVPVPDFLDEGQQRLYRQAHSLYIHLLGDGVEYWELYPQTGPHETVEIDGRTYLASRGPFAAWKDFDAAIRAVFTDEFWTALNKAEIYVCHGEQLCFLDVERGIGYYRDDSRPDTFTLVEETEDELSFTLTGYYSAPGGGGEEYTIDFPIRMVRTEAGWRFDEFHETTVDELAPEELS